MIKVCSMHTSQILLYRALHRRIDGEWIDWAGAMLQKGYDTPHLRMLAGESPPFNQSELRSLVDHVLRELDLDWSDARTVVENFTAELLERMLREEVPTSSALATLARICVELDYDHSLYDFYLLHRAQVDLAHSEMQAYLPGVNRGDIRERTRERALSWIAEHRGGAQQATAADGTDSGSAHHREDAAAGD
jgi:hypothetical protein